MKRIINQSEFIDAFAHMGRENQFSYNGKVALFASLEEYEDSTGEEIELDVIALCVEYTEYKDLAELQENYTDIETMEELQEHTTVIIIDTESFIIQDY